MDAQGRYRVEHDNDEGLPVEASTFTTIERAKELALRQLAYGYRSRVLDLASGAQVCPPEDAPR